MTPAGPPQGASLRAQREGSPVSDRLLLRGVHLASFAPGAEFEQRDGALLVEDGRIAWLGAEADLPASHRAAPVWDGAGAWLTPGLNCLCSTRGARRRCRSTFMTSGCRTS